VPADEEGAVFADVAEAVTGICVTICSVARRAIVARSGTCRSHHADRACGQCRPDWIGNQLLARAAACRHADLQHGCRAISRLPWLGGRVDWRSSVDCRFGSPDPIAASRRSLAYQQSEMKNRTDDVDACRPVSRFVAFWLITPIHCCAPTEKLVSPQAKSLNRFNAIWVVRPPPARLPAYRTLHRRVFRKLRQNAGTQHRTLRPLGRRARGS
jgi:hypothetical protein